MSNAYKQVQCVECGREYICTPHDDAYTVPGRDGLHCEQCMLKVNNVPEGTTVLKVKRDE